MYILNKIDLNKPGLASFNIRLDDSIETVLLQWVEEADMTEDMVCCLFNEDSRVLESKEGIEIAEVMKVQEDDGVYYLATGIYPGQGLFPLLQELNFTFCTHMGSWLPSDVVSIDCDYSPVTMSPIVYTEALEYKELKDEKTGEYLAITFEPPTNNSHGLEEAGISIAFNNHMFYQYFGHITLEDGTHRFVSFDVPISVNQTTALTALQNDTGILERKANIKINFIAEELKVTKLLDVYTVSATVMLIYPFVVETKILEYRALDDVVSNPFGFDEDVISILIESGSVETLHALKESIHEKSIDNL